MHALRNRTLHVPGFKTTVYDVAIAANTGFIAVVGGVSGTIDGQQATASGSEADAFVALFDGR